MKWNVTYVCVEPLLRSYSQSQTQEYILRWNITFNTVYVRRCVCARTGVCVCVLFWWCRLVYSSNYASWCMSVLMPAYVCMFTAF